MTISNAVTGAMSMIAEDHISICVCTCRRTNFLDRCLESLRGIELPAHTAINIAVVDNDVDASARELVQSKSADFPFPLHYHHELQSGIPFARNRAIEETLRLNGDFLVFIDDDEWVEVNWFAQLFGYCKSKGGEAIISGDVVQELPANSASHLKEFFKKRRRETGTELTACATNNVMIPIFICRDLGLRFDVSNPQMGGTDTVFFTHASMRGVPIFKCAEALVHETIPESRANMRWLSRRKYRVGVVASWRRRKQGKLPLVIAVSSLGMILVELLKVLLASVTLQVAARNRYWLRACKYAGILTGVFGLHIDDYKTIHGD